MRAGAAKCSQSKNDTLNRDPREIKMPVIHLRLGAFSAALALLAATSSTALAQKKYDIGATDTEIKIGNIMPYSGPASAYGVIGKTEEAYFRKINAEGGINGRKINFVMVRKTHRTSSRPLTSRTRPIRSGRMMRE